MKIRHLLSSAAANVWTAVQTFAVGLVIPDSTVAGANPSLRIVNTTANAAGTGAGISLDPRNAGVGVRDAQIVARSTATAGATALVFRTSNANPTVDAWFMSGIGGLYASGLTDPGAGAVSATGFTTVGGVTAATAVIGSLTVSGTTAFTGAAAFNGGVSGSFNITGGIGVSANLNVGGGANISGSAIVMGAVSAASASVTGDITAGGGITSRSGNNLFAITGGGTNTTQVIGEGAVSFIVQRASSDANSAQVRIFKARGTLAAPAAALTGDVTGQITFEPYTGVNYRPAAMIQSSFTDATIGELSVGSSLDFYTAATGTRTLTKALSIDSSQDIIIGVTASRSTKIGSNGQITTRYDDNSATGTLMTGQNLSISAAGQGFSVANVQLGVGGSGAAAASIQVLSTDTWAATANRSARQVFNVTTAGTSQTAMTIDGVVGIQFWSGTLVNSSGVLVLKSYTIATLPAASTIPGAIVYCTNLGGGAGYVASNGTAWRRLDHGYSLRTDTGTETLTVLNMPDSIEYPAAGGVRTITLGVTGAVSGDRFDIVCAASSQIRSFVNGGPAAGTLVATTASAHGSFNFVFDGTNWRIFS